MHTFVLLITSLMMVATLGVLLRRSTTPRQPLDQSPYVLRETLFSPSELSMLGLLDHAVGDRYQVFDQVKASSVISVLPSEDPRVTRWASNRISAERFDFVLCERGSQRIVAAIANCASSTPGKAAGSPLLEQVCRLAALPLVRLPQRQNWTAADLRRHVLDGMGDVGTPSDAALVETHRRKHLRLLRTKRSVA